jgi:hypothetical protein
LTIVKGRPLFFILNGNGYREILAKQGFGLKICIIFQEMLNPGLAPATFFILFPAATGARGIAADFFGSAFGRFFLLGFTAA